MLLVASTGNMKNGDCGINALNAGFAVSATAIIRSATPDSSSAQVAEKKLDKNAA